MEESVMIMNTVAKMGISLMIASAEYRGSISYCREVRPGASSSDSSIACGGVFGPTTTTIGDFVLWNNASGTLVADGGAPGVGVRDPGINQPGAIGNTGPANRGGPVNRPGRF